MIKIFKKQNIWITILGIIIGIIVGYYVTNYIFKNVIADNYDFFAYIKPSTYVIAAIGTIIISYITSSMISRKVRKIDMVKSLKTNE